MRRNQIYLIATIISAIALIWTVQYTQASVDYWMSEQKSFTVGHNSITINCKNGGQMDGDFSLVVTFVNASFSKSTGQPYSIVDNSTVKFYYSLHPDESRTKTVFFDIDESVDGFSIHISIEQTSWIMKTNKGYAQDLVYEWTEVTNSYRLIE